MTYSGLNGNLKKDQKDYYEERRAKRKRQRMASLVRKEAKSNYRYNGYEGK